MKVIPVLRKRDISGIISAVMAKGKNKQALERVENRISAEKYGGLTEIGGFLHHEQKARKL